MRDHLTVDYDNQDGYRGELLEVESRAHYLSKRTHKGSNASEIYKMLVDPDYLKAHDEKIKKELLAKYHLIDLEFIQNAFTRQIIVKIDYNSIIEKFSDEERLDALLETLKRALKIKGD